MKCLVALFASTVCLVSGVGFAEEDINLTSIKENIEKTLAAPQTEEEYLTAQALEQTVSATAISSSALAAARPVCYSALKAGQVNKSIIMVPLPNNLVDLDAVCHISINSGWHAGGVAKSNYFYQNCNSLDNTFYQGGYTSFATEAYFESNRGNYTNCNSNNAVVCCSPQFPN